MATRMEQAYMAVCEEAKRGDLFAGNFCMGFSDVCAEIGWRGKRAPKFFEERLRTIVNLTMGRLNASYGELREQVTAYRNGMERAIEMGGYEIFVDPNLFGWQVRRRAR